MNRAILIILSASYMAFSQCYQPFSQSFSMRDAYFPDIFLAKSNRQNVTHTIKYPGLKYDSSKTTKLGFGLFNTVFMPDSFSTKLSYSPINQSFKRLYAWGQKHTKHGTLGGWLGHLGGAYAKSNKNESPTYKNSSSNFSGRVALWYLPKKNIWFKGASLVLNDHNSEHETKSDKPSYKRRIEGGIEHLDITANGLMAVSRSWNFQMSINLNFHDYEHSNISRNSYSSRYNSHFSESKRHEINNGTAAALSLQMLSQHGQILGVSLNSSVFESKNIRKTKTTSRYGRNEEKKYEEVDGKLSLSAWAQKGTKAEWKGHSLNFGYISDICVNFPHEYRHAYYINDVIRDSKMKNREVIVQLSTPLVIEGNLYKKKIYAFFRLDPALSIQHIKNNNVTTELNAQLYKSQTRIGLQGGLGDRFQFALIPSINSSIYISGFEMSYSF